MEGRLCGYLTQSIYLVCVDVYFCVWWEVDLVTKLETIPVHHLQKVKNIVPHQGTWNQSDFLNAIQRITCIVNWDSESLISSEEFDKISVVLAAACANSH